MRLVVVVYEVLEERRSAGCGLRLTEERAGSDGVLIAGVRRGRGVNELVNCRLHRFHRTY